MITLPFLRKKKEKLRKPYFRREEKEKREKIKRVPKEKKKGKVKKEVAKSSIAFKVLKEPIISEKETKLEEEGKYVFKIWPRAKKRDIKRAIEEIYGVHVKKINIIKIPGKKRKIGMEEGWKPGYKKAIATLKSGEKIEIVPR